LRLVTLIRSIGSKDASFSQMLNDGTHWLVPEKASRNTPEMPQNSIPIAEFRYLLARRFREFFRERLRKIRVHICFVIRSKYKTSSCSLQNLRP
jgi:hypothetical protein